jgi:hypothetical protein
VDGFGFIVNGFVLVDFLV